MKWALILREYDIKFSPKPSTKAQVFVDFVAECTRSKEHEKNLSSIWKLFVDGLVKALAAWAGVVLKDPEGFSYEYALKLQFQVTHNVIEYEAMLIGLQLAHTMEAKELTAFNDSQLVV